MSDYKLLRIDSSFYIHIRQLYIRAFNLKPSIEYLRNKYNTNCFGLQHAGYIAFDENNSPAAYYGVFPIIFTIDGKDYLAAQSGDTMTDPNHQKKGLFTQLAKETYYLSIENNVNFVFGFPNKNSFPGFVKKLDWKFYDYMYNFQFVNKTLPFSEISFKLPFLKRIYHVYTKNIIAKYLIPISNENVNLFNSEHSLGYVKKDIIFLQYKMYNKFFLIRIKDFTILIKADGHLLIGDVVPFKKERLLEFIRVIKKLAVILLCRKTVFTLNKNHWLYSYLCEIKTPIQSLPIGFFEINKDIPYENISFTLADYDTF